MKQQRMKAYGDHRMNPKDAEVGTIRDLVTPSDNVQIDPPEGLIGVRYDTDGKVYTKVRGEDEQALAQSGDVDAAQAAAEAYADSIVDTNEYITLAASDEDSDLTPKTAAVTYRMKYDMTLTEVSADVNTAPTGSAIQVDINRNGVSILSTKITIDANEKTSKTAAVSPVISDIYLVEDDEIVIDRDAVGSVVAGTGLKVSLIGERTS